MKNNTTLFIIGLFFSLTIKSQNLYFPPLTGNVWDSILPASIGYCQPRIDSLYNYLQEKNTKSFMILKDGKRVLEKYFGTYTRDSLWYWASASKSLASFITGIAQQKGYININNTASQYLGTGWTSAPLAKENLITVKILLTMTSGLDDVPPSPCTNEDTAKACLIYKADASTRWAYHTGAYRNIQNVVSNAVGQSYNAITTNWIKTHIGIGGAWSQQVYYSKARDMARFGLLNLNKGVWNNDTLMKDSMYFKAMVNTSQTLNSSYGYLWWLNGKSSFMTPQSQIVFPGTLMSNAPSDMFCALGKNDQKIYVVPSQGIVVVRQGNTAGGFSLAASAFDNVLWDYINKLTCATNVIKTNGFDQEMNMFPNPVNTILKVNQINQSIRKISVYDILGHQVYEMNNIKSVTTDIDFSDFSKGVYIIEIENFDKNTLRKKIIKE
jgi:CubicO group peptidase (beta-lactamase class C family)